MTGTEKTYIAIDLKSFYASAECAERGLNDGDDPFRSHVFAEERIAQANVIQIMSILPYAAGSGKRFLKRKGQGVACRMDC